MKNKEALGQFYTSNAKYIIGNLIKYLPKDNPSIVDPFAGKWDLLNIMPEGSRLSAYDIDPQNEKTSRVDTLTCDMVYDGYHVVTNPPYLASNKNNSKTNKSPHKKNNTELYKKYQLNDLYKIALKTIMSSSGGIIIIPLNFFCEESSVIRQEFLSKYTIKHLNIFEENVFKDTSYTVCSFYFEKAKEQIPEQEIDITIFPSKEKLKMTIQSKFNFRLAGEFYHKLKVESKVNVSRLIKGDKPNSKIKLRALDTGTENGRIGLEIAEHYFDETPNQTERAFCTLKFDHQFTMEEQELIVEKFNAFLERNRDKYNSLFLTNFRNSTASYARKRIGFSAAYDIVKYIIDKNKELFTSLNS